MATDYIMEQHTPNAIREKGMNVLMRELGVRGMVEFLNQISPPKGDYTKEREELLAGITPEDLMRDLAEKKKNERSLL